MIEVFTVVEVRQVRRLLGVPQTALAESLGLDRATYGRKEREERFWLHEAISLTKGLLREAERQGVNVRNLDPSNKLSA